jgi:hypothetical protein
MPTDYEFVIVVSKKSLQNGYGVGLLAAGEGMQSEIPEP